MRASVLAVIPARYASQRFPGKALAPLRGRPLIEWVWLQAKKARNIDEVWIATDDERIAEAARGFGAHVAMTSAGCASGTDRIAEAVAGVDVGLVVNIQGDEPQIDLKAVERAVQALMDDPEISVSTARIPITRREDFDSPNVVKVVTSSQGRALYFSRSPIPSLARVGQTSRSVQGKNMPEQNDQGNTDRPGGLSYEMPVPAWKHLGMYVYRKPALEAFCRLAPSPLEQIERLEQLRFLENGFPIVVVDAARDSIGVDTPEELERLQKIFSLEGVS